MVNRQQVRAAVPTRPIGLVQAFDIQPGEVISLVGAGGKTTLMFALAGELASGGGVIATTTTTKIFEWQAAGTHLIIESDDEKMIAMLLEQIKEHRQVTLAKERLPGEGKLSGISPELVAKLAKLEQVSCIIIEADGAARKPLKAPNATEPVIAPNTSLVIPVVGFDALGSKLTEEEVFRPEIISRLTGLSMGDTISADAIATLITHPDGITKGSPPDARIIPVINKVDLAGDLSEAEELANRILEKGHPRIERVVLGQIQLPEPIAKIVPAIAAGA